MSHNRFAILTAASLFALSVSVGAVLAAGEPDPPGSRNPNPATKQAPAGQKTTGQKKKKEQTEDQRVKAKVREMIDGLIAEYDASDRGMEIRQVAGGYRMSPSRSSACRSFMVANRSRPVGAAGSGTTVLSCVSACVCLNAASRS